MSDLNERQLSICEDLGLPTAYEKLTVHERKMLDRIEELLEYLEKKYDRRFFFVAYYRPLISDEYLEAFSDETNEYEYTTLTVHCDGSFEDDYLFQREKFRWRSSLLSKLAEETNLEFKAYVDPNGEKKSWVSFTVFVSDVKEGDSERIGQSILGWYRENNAYGSANVIAVEQARFKLINYETYRSVKRVEGIGNLITCEVNREGNEKII